MEITDNILDLLARTHTLAKSIVDAWLASDFAGGNSTRKVEKIKQIDADYRVKEHS